jgi:dephospho-CoA kinase
MIQVGITGNIGSGKTTVCRLFELLNIPVYYADTESKILLENDEKVIKEVKKLFGSKAYSSDGKPDRKFIAGIVFKEQEKLKSLEGILHPAVQQSYRNWAGKQNSPYILKEAALLFESGSFKELDKLIVVASPKEVRINRVVIRDGITLEQAKARNSNQWPEEEKLSMADYIVHNIENLPLIPQIIKINRLLLSNS